MSFSGLLRVVFTQMVTHSCVVFFADYTGEEVLPELEGKKLKEVLLEPTRIYVKAVLPLIKEELVKRYLPTSQVVVFIENVPRMFADDLAAEIDESKVPVLPNFQSP